MMKMIASKNPTRRQFLASTGAVAGSLLMRAQASGVNSPLLQGEAEHVVSIWLGGGMGQIDTFDPKAKGDPKAKVPGSYYDSIDTACLLYTSPSPRDLSTSRMPSSA